jgi:hypothetical protein
MRIPDRTRAVARDYRAHDMGRDGARPSASEAGLCAPLSSALDRHVGDARCRRRAERYGAVCRAHHAGYRLGAGLAAIECFRAPTRILEGVSSGGTSLLHG